jgi:pyruvate dehydrogenase E2 component (dihydrolipoamide acetyltransferase)
MTALAITLPDELWSDVSDDTEALLEQWLVAEGAAVAAGQPVAMAVLLKASIEVLAPADGALAAILVQAGDTFGRGVAVGTLNAALASVATPPPASVQTEAGHTAERQIIPFTGMRGSIARNLSLAWQAPRVAVGLEVDISGTLARLEAVRAGAPARPTLTSLVIRAAALALRAHPRLNALVSEDGITLADCVHVAVAVSLEDGLLTPVIRDADRKPAAEIAAEVAGLAAAARAGELSPGALQGGSFTVSTLGAAGVDWFTPVLNPPQAAILGVGRVREGLVVRAGSPAVASLITLTLVFDHRAVDGVPAARFLAEVGRLLGAAEL